MTQLVGAGLHERAETRLTHRNGCREREWDTRLGTIELDIPKRPRDDGPGRVAQSYP